MDRKRTIILDYSRVTLAVLIENAFFYSVNTEAGWVKNGKLVENGIRSEGTERSFSDFTVKGEQKKLEQLLNEGGDYG